MGVHTGGVLAGVLGQRQWQFDVYSKDVELANKMESSGLPGRVHISNATLRFLNGEFAVSDGDGAQREDALRLNNIKTFFIDRVLKPVSKRPPSSPATRSTLTSLHPVSRGNSGRRQGAPTEPRLELGAQSESESQRGARGAQTPETCEGRRGRQRQKRLVPFGQPDQAVQPQLLKQTLRAPISLNLRHRLLHLARRPSHYSALRLRRIPLPIQSVSTQTRSTRALQLKHTNSFISDYICIL